MIITVTLNAAVDKTMAVPNFQPGRRHRTVDQTTMPGGKGVNIARVLKLLGQPVIATGLAGGAAGLRIVDQLTEMSVLSSFVRIREESRTNTALIDPTTGQQTEVNERGPQVSQQEIELFADKLAYLCKGASLCVFAGSLPRGVDVDIYGRLIREVRRLGVLTVIDTDGDPLLRAVRAEPDVISPNLLEAEELVGYEFGSDEDYAPAVAEMVEMGAREAIMTVPDGCVARVTPDDGGVEDVRVTIPSVEEAAATIGSGDAFLAGYVAARYSGKSAADCLAYGVACGAESTQHLGAGVVEPEAVHRLLAEVEVVRIPAKSGERVG
jgi:1-phosphofructokinase family hexose kinase